MSDADPYRDAPLHEIEGSFSFETDSRRLFRHVRRRVFAWRLAFAFFAFLGALILIAGHEPDVPDTRVPVYLALATLGGWLIAVVGKLSNNSLGNFAVNDLAAVAADRLWAFTGKKCGMVIFSRTQVFIEAQQRVLPLSAVEEIAYVPEHRSVRLRWYISLTKGVDAGEVLLDVPSSISDEEAIAKIAELRPPRG